MKLFYSAGITLLVGFIAGFATASSVNGWYTTINKPAFNPPNWLFAPVWTTLYIMMGIALYLIWRLPASVSRNKAMLIFFVQLALNFSWSMIFFGLHSPGWALVDIVLMLITIILTITAFKPLSKPAAWLLAPYLLWVSFATVLNASVWYLNK